MNKFETSSFWMTEKTISILGSQARPLLVYFFIGVLSISFATLPMQAKETPPYRIASDTRFNGIDLSPDGQDIVIASSSLKGGVLAIVTAETMLLQDTISLPPGVLPVDPRYNSDGSKLVFAGICSEKVSDCSGPETGWNIYTHDFATEETLQVTTPDPWFVRRGPAWGPDGRILFVGITAKHGGSSLTSSSAIFEIFEGGHGKPIFPRDSISKRSQSIATYNGKLTSLSIVSVLENGIVFKAYLRAGIDRISNERLDRLEKSLGITFDERLTRFADENIYPNPKGHPFSRATGGTLFWLTEDKLEIFHEQQSMTGELPDRLIVHAVTAEDDEILVKPSFLNETLNENFTGKLLKFEDYKLTIIDPLEGANGTLEGLIVDFEVAAGRAIFATRRNNGSVGLYTIINWKSISEYRLRPPKGK